MEPGESDSDLIVCRCEEVVLKTIRDALEQGDSSVDSVKLRTRAGMGICQGRTCLRVVHSLVRERYPEGASELPKQRWPVRPMPLGPLARPLDAAPELQIPLMELDFQSLEAED